MEGSQYKHGRGNEMLVCKFIEVFVLSAAEDLFYLLWMVPASPLLWIGIRLFQLYLYFISTYAFTFSITN